MNKGLQWHKKKFTVPLQVVRKDNPCWDCANNKYHGDPENLESMGKCVSCVGYNHYEKKCPKII